MISRAAKRVVCIALVTTAADFTALGEPAHGQTTPRVSNAPAAAVTPVGAAPNLSPVAHPATPAATAAGTAVGSPMSVPTPDATVEARRRICARYAAVLSGRTQDRAALDTREIKTLAMNAPDLAICGAVMADSEEFCTSLFPEGHGPTGKCRETVAAFRELRSYPKSHSFLINFDMQELPAMKPVLKAVRAGDLKQCAAAGDLESVCRAFIQLDESLCKVKGKLAEMENPSPKHEGHPKLGPALEDMCKQVIAERGYMAKGLKEIATSGPPRERELAKAVLGEVGACAQYEQAATQSCVGMTVGTPVPAGTPAAPSDSSAKQERAATKALPGASPVTAPPHARK